MISSYRVIVAYYSKKEQRQLSLDLSFYSEGSLSLEQITELQKLVENDPYHLRDYVKKNKINIKAKDYLNCVLRGNPSPVVMRDYLNAGLMDEKWLRTNYFGEAVHKRWLNLKDHEDWFLDISEDNPGVLKNWLTRSCFPVEDPIVQEALMAVARRHLIDARDFAQKGWIDTKSIEVKKILVRHWRALRSWIRNGWLTPQDAEFLKKEILETIVSTPHAVYDFISEGLISHDVPLVKKTLLDNLQRDPDPDSADYLLSRGWVTIDDRGVKEALAAPRKDHPDFF